MQQPVVIGVDRSACCETYEIEEQLSRILQSQQFRSSPVLQAFLRFVVTKSVDCQEDTLTEQSIATEVFGRDSHFDSTADTVVRTQAYRLRQKLKEYYAAPGQADAVLIDVPKGHYRACFSRRETEMSAAHVDRAPEVLPVGPIRSSRPFTTLQMAVAGLFLLLAGIGVGRMLSFSRDTTQSTESKSQLKLDRFWSSFLGSDRSPIIAYSNDLYLTTESGTLLTFSGPTADRGTLASPEVARLGVSGFNALSETGPLYFEDDKTDVGEVVSSSALTAQLARMGVHPVLKRGRVVTTFDLESHNVIFLGSPFANKILEQLEGNSNFVFRHVPGAPPLWGGAIFNLHPRAGESKAYALERDAQTRALKSDYAIVSSIPGLATGRKILILAGLTTSGTQAAAQFVTSTSGIEAMTARIGHARGEHGGSWPPSFEYLLKVTLDRGLDVLRSECISSRNPTN